MKITKSQLKQIIKEELEATMKEGGPAGHYITRQKIYEKAGLTPEQIQTVEAAIAGDEEAYQEVSKYTKGMGGEMNPESIFIKLGDTLATTLGNDPYAFASRMLSDLSELPSG
tara:strand:+ start:745 stop:1083 length:339 start_codon:yes stop_codon:yes gene_type:complete